VAKPTQVPPQPATATPDAAAARDRQIAEAIKKRAGAVEKPAVDDQIAAAVRKRAEQLTGGGEGVSGPLSSGPGNVAGGGTIIGAEYILFKRRMEARIRDAWVWAGPEEQLESVVRFSVSPAGEIGEVRTTRSSGDPAYDASAERAVRAANPLGMVPPAYHQEFADVELTFRASDLQR
jgi:colicin import membrane protein